MLISILLLLLKRHVMSETGGIAFEDTLRVKDTCLCLHVQRAARALARRYGGALRLLKLSSGQFSILMSLHRPDAPTMGAVSGDLAMGRTTLTANLKPLERRGLLTIAVDPSDRRNRRLSLTRAGLQTLADALPLWEGVQRETRKLLGDSDPARVCEQLCTLS